MNTIEYEKFLIDKYDLNTSKSIGIGVPFGWRELIENLIEELILLGWNKEIHQVKSKFDSLRFYTGDVTDEMQKLISAAEQASQYICLTCGKSMHEDLHKNCNSITRWK